MAARLAGGRRPENPHGPGKQKRPYAQRMAAISLVCQHCPNGPECAMKARFFRDGAPRVHGPREPQESKNSMRNFHFPGRSTVHATNAMVATSHPQASLAAIEVLREGGTAVDAAVAGSALLGVIEPQSTGIGGDCFALIQPRGEGKIIAYNGSGRAPKAANADWYLERKINSIPLTSAH